VALSDLGAVKTQAESIGRTVQQIEAIRSQVETLSNAAAPIAGIKSQVESITQTVQQLHSMRSDLEQVKARETQLNETVGRIASKLIGTREVGAAGENILSEAFACFPPGWIETDFRIGGKVVEFALVLPNHKRLPIDSKFPAAGPLQRLGEETDGARRQEIVKQIENAILAKAQEAAKYIDPARTIPLAVAAIPDAAYGVCRKAHFDAIRSDVLVISYSMALPVVLALYRFQLQFATTIDQQNLENYLRNIESSLKVMEEQFENRIKEAGTRIGNAYGECTQQIAKIRGALSALRTPALPAPDPQQQGLELGKPYLLEKTEG
jgi:DNA anti-recombination protein RmuC